MTDTKATEPKTLLGKWILRPIKQQLTQGTTPHKIAQAIAFGLTIGIFPIIGSTTLLTLAVGIPLKLNQPVLQTFKTIAGPIQWALILGYYRVGEWLFRAEPVSLSIPKMVSEFSEAPLQFFLKYGQTALYGICVWFITAPILMLAIYWIARPMISKFSKEIAPSP